MASSAGNASVAAPALRKVLRGKGVLMVLFGSENAALDDLVQQCPETVALGLGGGDNFFDFSAVGEGEVGAGPVNEKFASEVAGDLVGVLEQDPFVLVDVLKGLAVGGFPVCLDGTGEVDMIIVLGMVGQLHPVDAIAALGNAVPFAPTA